MPVQKETTVELRQQYDLALPQSRLSTKIVAAGIGAAVLTLEKWRSDGKGPPYHKIDTSADAARRGGRIYYVKAEVETWIAEREAA